MNSDVRDHLIRVLKDFDTALLFTRNAEGHLWGRPMGLAEVEEDGSLYLSTDRNSEKVRELSADPHAAIAVQGRTKCASLSGFATVDTNRANIHRLWKESWKLWFPEGKDDPNLCLIRFDPREGEYWDSSGLRGVKFLMNAAKAYLSGERPERPGVEGNAKVDL